MRGVWRVAVLGLMLNGCAAGRRTVGPQDGNLAPGDHELVLEVDGTARRYLVHLPRSGASPRALVLALHGGGGNAAQFRDENSLEPAADRDGFIVVHPDGTGPIRERFLTWNSGDNCCGWAHEHGIDDVEFLARLIDDLARRTSIDRQRVFVTGHSNGAMMAYRFAAERAKLVAGIIPVSGAMSIEGFEPSRPVAVLDIHSVDDPRALYDGGLGPPFPGTGSRVQHAAVVDGLRAWADANGCRGATTEVDQRTGSGRDRGQTAVRLVWAGCPTDAPVEHLRLTEVGHGWPGSAGRPLTRNIIGPPTTLVDAADEVAGFVARVGSRSGS